MKITIKNMNCPANILFVRMELERLSIPYKSLEMGSAELYYVPAQTIRKELSKALSTYGLKIVYNDRSIIIQDIKSAIFHYEDNTDIEKRIDLPSYVAEAVNYPFPELNKIFLNETGSSIEKYFQSKKIERAIILLMRYNLTLNEISIQLNYNNVEEFIQNFRIITGMMPDRYKQLRNKQNIFAKRIGQKAVLQ